MSGVLVMDAGILYSPLGGMRGFPEQWGLDDLLELANSVRPVASTVLVLNDAGWDGVVDERRHTVTGSQSAEPWRYQVASLTGEPPLSVVFMEHDAGGHFAGPFHGLDARELCVVLARLHDLLGVWWADSVGRTFERLTLATHPKGKGGTQLDRKPFCPDDVAVPSLELDLQSWRRPLTPAERVMQQVHVYDANAQHLSALAGVEVGHGVPQHTSGPFDARVAGFWHFPDGLDGLPTPATELLPPPWLPDRHWYSTATVARMLEVAVGMDVPTPVEGWVWPKRSRFFRGAAERLRDARAKARQVKVSTDARLAAGDATAVQDGIVADVVLEAVKMLYARAAGRLGMQRDSESPWYRPDWGHEIRATARVNMHRRLGNLTAAPFAIATDALAFAAPPHVDADHFASYHRLPLGDGMGQYRHVATVSWDRPPLTDRQAAQLALLGTTVVKSDKPAGLGALLDDDEDQAAMSGAYLIAWLSS